MTNMGFPKVQRRRRDAAVGEHHAPRRPILTAGQDRRTAMVEFPPIMLLAGALVAEVPDMRASQHAWQ